MKSPHPARVATHPLLPITLSQALARVADFLSPPSLTDLRAAAQAALLREDGTTAAKPTPEVHPLTEYFLRQKGELHRRRWAAAGKHDDDASIKLVVREGDSRGDPRL